MVESLQGVDGTAAADRGPQRPGDGV